MDLGWRCQSTGEILLRDENARVRGGKLPHWMPAIPGCQLQPDKWGSIVGLIEVEIDGDPVGHGREEMQFLPPLRVVAQER
jgi:hypothetical protein